MPTYIALIKEDTGWWYGWIAEIPGVNCQERTREALLETLDTRLGLAQNSGAAVLPFRPQQQAAELGS